MAHGWVSGCVIGIGLLTLLGFGLGGRPEHQVEDGRLPGGVSGLAAASGLGGAARQDDDDDDDEPEPAPDPEAALTDAIRQHLDRITSAKFVQYDGSQIVIEYRDAGNFLKDTELLGKHDPRHVGFDMLTMRGKESKPRSNDSYACFEGNTEGNLILYPHFKGKIRLLAKVQFMFVEDRSSFVITAHSDNKSRFVATDFGVHLVDRSTKRPKIYQTLDPVQRTSLRKWLDRTAPQIVALEWDPATKVAECSLSKGPEPFADISGARPASLTKEFKEGLDRGQVGFMWKNDVKFVVQRLRIEAELDREWAAEAIKNERITN